MLPPLALHLATTYACAHVSHTALHERGRVLRFNLDLVDMGLVDVSFNVYYLFVLFYSNPRMLS